MDEAKTKTKRVAGARAAADDLTSRLILALTPPVPSAKCGSLKNCTLNFSECPKLQSCTGNFAAKE